MSSVEPGVEVDEEVFQPGLEEARSVLRRVLGDIDLGAKVAQIKETLQREGT